MDQTWKSVLGEIELEVSKPTFLTFFKDTNLLSITDSVATITSPKYIAAEYLEKRYYSLIKRILDKKLNGNISIVFISDNRKSPEKKVDMGPLFAREIQSKSTTSRPQRIRADYTFETLAVSESNQLAYTAGVAIVKDPGVRYNPLYLYGPVGVGKTHLMHAIANEIFDSGGVNKVVYLTTEEFTNEVVEAILEKTTTQMRKKFRNADLLLLDDIQFLSGKEKVQEELFHTFNSLIDKGKQIIFASDRPPSEIKKIEARLASRFEGGLTVDIQAPDFELRTAILQKKAGKYNLDLSYDIAKMIAEKITDVRALEGFLLRLMSESIGKNLPTEIHLVRKLLNGKRDSDTVIKADDVIKMVCEHYSIKQTQLKGSKRNAYLVLPRHVCMYLLKEQAGLTLIEIGNLMGGRDHTTVMHAVEKVETLVENSSKVKEEVLFITRQLKTSYLQ